MIPGKVPAFDMSDSLAASSGSRELNMDEACKFHHTIGGRFFRYLPENPLEKCALKMILR
jgi:hypothetical protein